MALALLATSLLEFPVLAQISCSNLAPLSPTWPPVPRALVATWGPLALEVAQRVEAESLLPSIRTPRAMSRGALLCLALSRLSLCLCLALCLGTLCLSLPAEASASLSLYLFSSACPRCRPPRPNPLLSLLLLCIPVSGSSPHLYCPALPASGVPTSAVPWSLPSKAPILTR